MKRLVLFAAAAALASAASAAPFSAAQVSADARWMAHLDVDLLKSTVVGQHLMAKLTNPTNDKKFAAIQAMFRFDPRRDLKSITLFGVDKDEKKSIVLIDGAFDATHLATILGAGEGYEQIPYQGETLHSWLDVKPDRTNRMHGFMLMGKQIVMGQDRPAVQNALDTLRGRRPALAGSALAALAPTAPGVLMAAADFRGLASAKPDSGIMQNATGGSMALTESSGEVALDIAMDTLEPARAQMVQQILQGIIALGVLGEKENQDFAKLCRSAKVSLDQAKVSLHVAVPVADFTAMMDKAEQQPGKGAK